MLAAALVSSPQKNPCGQSAGPMLCLLAVEAEGRERGRPFVPAMTTCFPLDALYGYKTLIFTLSFTVIIYFIPSPACRACAGMPRV